MKNKINKDFYCSQEYAKKEVERMVALEVFHSLKRMGAEINLGDREIYLSFKDLVLNFNEKTRFLTIYDKSRKSKIVQLKGYQNEKRN